MAGTATTSATKQVLNYAVLTKRLQDNVYPGLNENEVFISCVRRVNSSKEGVMAVQVEYLERLPRPASASTQQGVNLSVLVNAQFDDRFQQSLNVKRAWATYTSIEALEIAIGGKLKATEIALLEEMEIGTEDRLVIMRPQGVLSMGEGKQFDVHIKVTEVRENEIEEVQLTKSQRNSLEHENAVLRTGGDNNEVIVCSITGQAIRQITEIVALPFNTDLTTIHNYIPNKVRMSDFNKSPKANHKVVGVDITAENALDLVMGE